MSEQLAHRGPDSHGIYRGTDGTGHVALAHRRLSIIDLSDAAGQPFSKDGLVLVYNGELYNYRSLRTELSGRGVRFRSSSDTEVVLEAWRYWGPRALERFRGMFAFGLFDERSGHLVLARDPLGIKPLFLHRDAGGVVFASELKALVRALGSELEIDAGALVASLLYYWVPETRCAVSGVKRTLAASPNTAAATAWQRSTSIPRQTPLESGCENPASPVLTPHCTKPFAFTESRVDCA